MFACRVCAEKDKRIADLKEENTRLASLILPPAPLTLSAAALEADGVLSGQQHPIVIEEFEEAREIQAERDRILAGTY